MAESRLEIDCRDQRHYLGNGNIQDIEVSRDLEYLAEPALRIYALWRKWSLSIVKLSGCSRILKKEVVREEVVTEQEVAGIDRDLRKSRRAPCQNDEEYHHSGFKSVSSYSSKDLSPI